MTNPQSRRALAKAATRRKVLEAAKFIFEAEGYERATIRQIANNAGMSTGAVFASFSGKVELYREIYGHPPISPEVGRELLAVMAGFAGEVSAINSVFWFDLRRMVDPASPAFNQAVRDAALRCVALGNAIARATSDPSEPRQDDEAAAAMRGAA